MLAVVALAGCGGGSTPATRVASTPATATSASGPFPDDPQIAARATTRAQQAALVTLARDIRAMRSAASGADRSLKGTPRTRKATSRFIVHLEESTIDDLSKNRVIDHAAAAVAVSCEQCFQQLEAMRPIPAIAH
jgi:hypothetical protein